MSLSAWKVSVYRLSWQQASVQCRCQNGKGKMPCTSKDLDERHSSRSPSAEQLHNVSRYRVQLYLCGRLDVSLSVLVVCLIAVHTEATCPPQETQKTLQVIPRGYLPVTLSEYCNFIGHHCLLHIVTLCEVVHLYRVCSFARSWRCTTRCWACRISYKLEKEVAFFVPLHAGS